MLIIFDLDDTLIDTSGCITPIKLEAALRRMIDAGLPVANFAEAWEKLLRIDSLMESGRETVKNFISYVGAPSHFLEIGLKEMYETSCSQISIDPCPGALKLLEELYELHDLALVTIGEKTQQLEKMKNAGIDTSVFSKIVVCDSKPGKKFCYEALSSEFVYAASEVLVCGDRIRADLSPAKALGFTTVHIRWGRGRNSAGPKNDVDHTISELTQLKNIFIRCTS